MNGIHGWIVLFKSFPVLYGFVVIGVGVRKIWSLEISGRVHIMTGYKEDWNAFNSSCSSVVESCCGMVCLCIVSTYHTQLGHEEG